MEKQRTRWLDIFVTIVLALGLLFVSGTLRVAIAIMPTIVIAMFIGNTVLWLIKRHMKS